MIIKDITLEATASTVRLSARCKIRKLGWDTLYFQLNGAQEEYVCADASPFAAALLLPAMRQGEPLVIHGRISQQLLDGMHEVMQVVQGWGIGLKPIEIRADEVTPDAPASKRTASFFSGGVDSFYTYLKHKTDTEPNGKVDSLVLINGYEIDLRSKDLWNVTLENVQAIADAEGVQLVTVESNAYKLTELVVPWDFNHGACLAAVGLFLRGTFSRFYIPSTFTADAQIPWGSNLTTDHMWSTECLSFIHDGAEATRLNKIVWQVSKSPVAHKHLRVCYMNEIGAYNCGVCPKCLRTMTGLFVAGVLDKCDTFPHSVDIHRIATTPMAINAGTLIFTGEEENLAGLRERNLAPELQQAILDGIALTKRVNQSVSTTAAMKFRLSKVMRRVMYWDYIYTRSALYAGMSRLFGQRFA